LKIVRQIFRFRDKHYEYIAMIYDNELLNSFIKKLTDNQHYLNFQLTILLGSIYLMKMHI